MLLKKIKILLLSFFRLFGLYILFFICVFFLEKLFPDIDLKKYSQDGLEAIFRDNKINAFITIVLFAAIFEEFMFRSIVRPTHNDLLLFLSAWTLFFIGFLYAFELVWYYEHMLTVLSIGIIFFIYKKTISITFLDPIRTYLENNQSTVLQLTSLIFGCIHIFNYVDGFAIDSTLFLLIVPRIILGHMNGLIKIKNQHVIWPILLHAINNGVVFIALVNRY